MNRYRALALILALALTRSALGHNPRGSTHFAGRTRSHRATRRSGITIRGTVTSATEFVDDLRRDVSTAREETSALSQKKKGQDVHFVDPSRISTGVAERRPRATLARVEALATCATPT